MSAQRLRIYWGPDSESTSATAESVEHTAAPVRISLSDLYDALSDAVTHRLAWVEDFEEEEVAVSSDLYDVILAYRSMHRPNSA